MNTTTPTVNAWNCPILLNPSAAEIIGKTCAYCLILVVSLVGNLFIPIIVYKTQTLRKPINFFIVNMAVSDLLFPVLFLPSELIRMHVGFWLVDGPLGQALCKLIHFLADCSSVVSVQSLVLIGMDRYAAVVFPLRSPLISSKASPFFIVATWIVAMAVNSPYLFAYKLVEYPGQWLQCEWRWKEAFGEFPSDANYTLANFVVTFYIPIVLLTILYSKLLIKLKTQVRPGEPSVNAEEQRSHRNRNVLKMSIAIVVTFVLCWVPWTISTLQYYFAWDSTMPCDKLLYYNITGFMALAYTAINPCICFLFSSNYRQGLKKLLNCFGAMQE